MTGLTFSQSQVTAAQAPLRFLEHDLAIPSEGYLRGTKIEFPEIVSKVGGGQWKQKHNQNQEVRFSYG